MYLDEEGNMAWPEILKVLFECTNSQDPALKESALQIFWFVDIIIF